MRRCATATRRGTLPADRAEPAAGGYGRHFQNQLSVGALVHDRVEDHVQSRISLQPGRILAARLEQLVRVGAAPAASAPITRAALVYPLPTRPSSRTRSASTALFLRADWVDAFVPHLELTGFINADLFDGSSLVQVTADYYLSDAWTIGVLATADPGRAHSDFGSLPQAASVLFSLARYF